MKEVIDKFTEKYPTIDEKLLQSYLEHIQKAALNENKRGHWHHILPRSMFPN